MLKIREYQIIEKIYFLIDMRETLNVVFDEWGIAEQLYAQAIGLDEED
jgi:hypothetical protein